MKQYLNAKQATKLIKLGVEKPKSIVDKYYDFDTEDYIEVNLYSIGELIEMLPRTIKNYYDLNILSSSQGWWVLYGMIGDGDMWSVEYEIYRSELIDALFAMIIKLKEEGKI